MDYLLQKGYEPQLIHQAIQLVTEN